tara:strand:- start:31 stop:261 length:231 start_codon:yes stop_codon:yes gene_type:complete
MSFFKIPSKNSFNSATLINLDHIKKITYSKEEEDYTVIIYYSGTKDVDKFVFNDDLINKFLNLCDQADIRTIRQLI